MHRTDLAGGHPDALRSHRRARRRHRGRRRRGVGRPARQGFRPDPHRAGGRPLDGRGQRARDRSRRDRILPGPVRPARDGGAGRAAEHRGAVLTRADAPFSRNLTRAAPIGPKSALGAVSGEVSRIRRVPIGVRGRQARPVVVPVRHRIVVHGRDEPRRGSTPSRDRLPWTLSFSSRWCTKRRRVWLASIGVKVASSSQVPAWSWVLTARWVGGWQARISAWAVASPSSATSFSSTVPPTRGSPVQVQNQRASRSDSVILAQPSSMDPGRTRSSTRSRPVVRGNHLADRGAGHAVSFCEFVVARCAVRGGYGGLRSPARRAVLTTHRAPRGAAGHVPSHAVTGASPSTSRR